MPDIDDIPRRLLVAAGGNATHPEYIEGTSQEQKDIAATAAAIGFLKAGGERVVICHLQDPMAALRGETGTHIVAADG